MWNDFCNKLFEPKLFKIRTYRIVENERDSR